MTSTNLNAVISLTAFAVAIGIYVLIKALQTEDNNIRIICVGIGILVFLTMFVLALCKKYNVFLKSIT